MREPNKPVIVGTTLAGANDRASVARSVQEMFSSIAHRYDLLNHLLSFSLDRWWWWRAARTFADVLSRPEARVLDLCCGTGDMAFALERRAKPGGAKIFGADFAHPMLERAFAKSNGSGLRWVEADALRLPFLDSSFDLITMAFGFRNLANYEDGLREMFRLLKRNGTLGILEFAEPPPGLLGDLYRFYTQKVLPKVGGLISGDAAAYEYLPKSVARFFRPDELAALMTRVGYAPVRYHLMTLGSVALHIAIRP
jgi:demethylmenaquinone methyltransferase/2-methoxy-6-polyprenyl-1,4-benzoquinol methylase